MNTLTLNPLLLLICLAVLTFNSRSDAATTDQQQTCPALLQHEFKLAHRAVRQDLCEAFQGKVILAVNTASRCGYTPQFQGLEALYKKYDRQGFVVLGFPSNDFYQELKSDKEIASFCQLNYGVTFPVFSKSSVKGSNANGFFQELIRQTKQPPQWNFNKYLIDRNGKVVSHYPSNTKPTDKALAAAIEALL